MLVLNQCCSEPHTPSNHGPAFHLPARRGTLPKLLTGGLTPKIFSVANYANLTLCDQFPAVRYSVRASHSVRGPIARMRDLVGNLAAVEKSTPTPARFFSD